MAAYEAYVNQDVAEAIQDAFEQTEGAMENEEVVEVYHNAMKQISGQNLILTDECDDYLLSYFSDLYDHRDADYANGRDVRNYFEKVMRTRANRLSPILDSLTVEQFRAIELTDLEKAKEMKSSNW